MGETPEDRFMTDAERVLHALLHDVRTPLGAAQGYLRLLQDNQLKTPADEERAVARALRALGDVARLCDSAGEFLDGATSSTVTRVSAVAFAKQVETHARHRGLAVSAAAIPADFALTVSGSIPSMCDAIVSVLSSSARGAARSGTMMHVRAADDELRFLAPPAERSAEEIEPDSAPLDRWWAHGLPLPVAWRRILASSGRVLACQSADDGLVVAFPLEQKPV